MSERVEGNLNKDMGDEYLVAADLTLYANPLRVLNRKSKPPPEKKEGDTTDEKAKDSKHEEKEMIAADLTKYGSPMDDRKQ